MFLNFTVKVKIIMFSHVSFHLRQFIYYGYNFVEVLSTNLLTFVRLALSKPFIFNIIYARSDLQDTLPGLISPPNQ